MKYFVGFPDCRAYIYVEPEEEIHMPEIIKRSSYVIKPVKRARKSPNNKGRTYVICTRSLFGANAAHRICRNIVDKDTID